MGGDVGSACHIIPERVADDEEGDVLGLRIAQNLVAVRLDHLPVGDYDGPSIVLLLLYALALALPCNGAMVWYGYCEGGGEVCYQNGLVDEKNARVRL